MAVCHQISNALTISLQWKDHQLPSFIHLRDSRVGNTVLQSTSRSLVIPFDRRGPPRQAGPALSFGRRDPPRQVGPALSFGWRAPPRHVGPALSFGWRGPSRQEPVGRVDCRLEGSVSDIPRVSSQVFCTYSLTRKQEVLFVDLPGILSRAAAQLLLLAAMFLNAVCFAPEVPEPCDFAYGAFFRPCW